MNKEKLSKLRNVVRRHLNWLIREIAGEDALTGEERKDLEGFKPLPKQASDFIQRSFILGRLKSILKKKEYKEVTLSRLDQAIKDADLTPLEKMALDEARRSAGNYIRNLTSDIEAGIFQRLSEAEGQIVTEATIRNIIREETAFAVLEEKTWKELASSLSDSLKVEYSKRMEMIARTELHAAKQKGIAQAIANKIDVYGASNGPDSDVSVVTQTGRCEDCARLYEDKAGNPKVFKLSHLLGNGSNATRNHKKVNKQHVHWVAVVPPSHPHCFCELVYVPPGYVWKDRKLILEDVTKLKKAIGDSTLSSVKKPKGPPQPGPTPPPQPGNVPGQASPAKATATPASPTASAGSGVVYEYWKGTGAPPAEGNWEAYQKKDGGQGYRRPEGSGGGGTSAPEDEAAKKQAAADAWKKIPHSNMEKLDHLTYGVIVSKKALDEKQKGATESWKVGIAGNGDAIMKPPANTTGKHADMWEEGLANGDGAIAVPHGTGHKREAAAFRAYAMFGLHDHVPPTVSRSIEGQATSMQAWEKGFHSASLSFTDKEGILYDKAEKLGIKNKKNRTETLLQLCPEEKKEQLLNKLAEGSVMGLVLNNNDMHMNNIMVNEEFDLRFVDNSMSVGNSMAGVKNQILMDFHSSNRKLKVPSVIMERFANTSLGDINRSIGGHVEDWAVGQTFLRMKYVMHLQATEGHLDYEKFRGQLGAAHEAGAPYRMPHPMMWNDVGSEEEQKAEFSRRQQAGLLPDQLFDSFAKQWIMDAKNLPEDHADRIAAERLETMGVIRGPGSVHQPDEYTKKTNQKTGKLLHEEYFESVKPGYPPKTISSNTGSSSSNKDISYEKTQAFDFEGLTHLGDQKPLRNPKVNRPDNTVGSTEGTAPPGGSYSNKIKGSERSDTDMDKTVLPTSRNSGALIDPDKTVTTKPTGSKPDGSTPPEKPKLSAKELKARSVRLKKAVNLYVKLDR